MLCTTCCHLLEVASFKLRTTLGWSSKQENYRHINSLKKKIIAVGWFMSAFTVKDLETTRLKCWKRHLRKRSIQWLSILEWDDPQCENFHDPHKQAPLQRKISEEIIHSVNVASLYPVTFILNNRLLNKVATMAGISSKSWPGYRLLMNVQHAKKEV